MSSEPRMEHIEFYHEFKVEKTHLCQSSYLWSFWKPNAWRDHALLAVQFQPPGAESPAVPLLAVPEFLTLKNPPADFITIIALELILHCRESRQENTREQNPDDQSSFFTDTVFMWVVFTGNIHLIIAQVPCFFNIISMVNAISYCAMVI